MKKLFIPQNLEYTRGVLASVISSIFSQIIIFLTQKTKVKHKEVILYVLTFVVANLISYSADILLAKSKFDGKSIPIENFTFRVKYLMEKLLSYQIIKFFVLVLIDVKVVSTLYKKLISFLDKKDIKFKNRDQIVMFVLTTLTFLLYGNMLRFNWVYVDEQNLVLDTLMLAWLTILWF
jgi:hypothetical protein